MRTVNILWAQGGLDNFPEDVIRKKFERFQWFMVGDLTHVSSKGEVSTELQRRRYDVLIVTDSIEGEPVGGGSVGGWKNDAKHDLKIILMMVDSKASGLSLFKMWQKGFYDYVFMKDFGSDGRLVAEMIAKGRTAEEAAEYYKLAENDSYQEYMASLLGETEEGEGEEKVR